MFFQIGFNVVRTNNNTLAEARIVMPTATVNRSSQQDSSSNPLYQRNYCRWPSCDTLCSSLMDFNRHLNDEHSLDDRSVAQARVQQHVVQQIEALLSRERNILQSMMKHLHGGNQPINSNGALSSSSNPATAEYVTTYQLSHTLTSCNNNNDRSIQLSSPTSSSTTAAFQHIPIVKLENALLTSADLFKTTAQDLSSNGNATVQAILRTSASSSPPPVHIVEEEVGDDTQEDEDNGSIIDNNGSVSTLSRSHGNSISIVSMSAIGKHQMNRKSKEMLALGGKKAGKGKGLLDNIVCHEIQKPFR